MIVERNLEESGWLVSSLTDWSTNLKKKAESALSAFEPRKAVPSSYLLSTTKACTLDAAADHKHKPVE
eukprot:1145246-Pelagomonas_calceolata.AAC.1